METILEDTEKYKKDAGQQTMTFTNKIAEEQSALQYIEAEKARLMIGNEEKTENRLKKTNTHGIIRMSIKSLYEKIAYKNLQNGEEVNFIWRSGIPNAKTEEGGGAARHEEYKAEDCEKQLETVKEYIEGFEAFMKLLEEPVDYDQRVGQRGKMNYYQKLAHNLEHPKTDAQLGVADEIDDFKEFDPADRNR